MGWWNLAREKARSLAAVKSGIVWRVEEQTVLMEAVEGVGDHGLG